MDYTPAIPVDDPMAVSQPESLGSSPADEILKIEQEIERHEQAIVNLKFKRNTHLPIFKLPVELLCKILHYTQDTWKAPHGYSHYAGFPSQELAWLAVTRVCQHWRNAALNEPSLWTRPPLNYAKWTTVMLERSRMAGVTISFNNEGCCVRPDLLTTVASHIPHTTSLTIQRISKQVVERLLTNLQSTVAPMLETLVMDGAYAPSYLVVAMIDSGDRVPTRLPENAFLGATKLHRLSLTSIDINWKSHLLSSLTDLTLEKISTGARPSRTEFLSMLERNTGLRKLTLRDALPTSVHLSSSSSDNRPRIQLMFMKNLSITSEGDECEFFCNNIATSDKIKSIHMSFKYNHNIRQLQKLLLAVHQTTSSNRLGSSSRRATIMGELSPGNIMGMPTLSLSTSGRVRGSFTYGPGIPDYCESDDSALDLDLDLQTPSLSSPGVNSRETNSAILSKFFHGLHWDNLAQLVISGLRVYGTRFSSTLAKTFGTLPQLRAVFVGDSCANHLIDALLINSDKDPRLFPDTVTFPGLCHIGFHEVTFDRDYEEDILKFDRLVDCLMNRCERGVEIYSVSVEDCRFFDETRVEQLEEIVVEVDWDEEEHGYSDDEDEDEDMDMDMDDDPEFYDDSDYEDDVYGLYGDY